MPIERGRNPEGRLEVVYSRLCLALGVVYITEEAMMFGGHTLIAFT